MLTHPRSINQLRLNARAVLTNAFEFGPRDFSTRGISTY